jgi:hypothetical protein
MATFYAETSTLVDKWIVEDVQELRPDLNHEQSCKVLEWIAGGFSAEIGINWDVIDCAAGYLFPQNLFPQKTAEDKEYEVGNSVSVE